MISCAVSWCDNQVAPNIVLYQPEIPQNTGNVARLCAVTGSSLHLVRPLGFAIDDRQLKRAGLDYWDLLDIHYYDSFDELYSANSDNDFHFFSKKARKSYAEIKYFENSFLVFGRETSGLPDEIMERFAGQLIRLPMVSDPAARSLNLSNTVAIAVYEVLRQNAFGGLM